MQYILCLNEIVYTTKTGFPHLTLKFNLFQLSHKEQLLQEAQHNLENVSKQIEGSDIESRVREFQEHTPLIETLQKELSSAQDTINALTNQNSELRATMFHRSSSDSSLREDGDHQVTTVEISLQEIRVETKTYEIRPPQK